MAHKTQRNIHLYFSVYFKYIIKDTYEQPGEEVRRVRSRMCQTQKLLAFLHVDVLNNPEVSEPYSLGTKASSGKCNHQQ